MIGYGKEKLIPYRFYMIYVPHQENQFEALINRHNSFKIDIIPKAYIYKAFLYDLTES